MIKIENYRGHEVFFDTSTDNFNVAGLLTKSGSGYNSYSTAKKAIDDFEKNNISFTPFMVHHARFPENELLITGVRKDGDFASLNGVDKKERLARYGEEVYIIPNSENNVIYGKIAEIKFKINNLKQEQITLENSIISYSLKDYRNDNQITGY